MIAHGQNFEDVLLWRAVGHIESGFYLDIGAQDPVSESVSRLFYEAGWRGIHVEPTAAYAAKLRANRPGETVIEAALSDKPGVLTLYEIPETGLSTGSMEIAHNHEKLGFSHKPVTVPCITLEHVFAQCQARDIHWLKIDVEGMEPHVLNGWGNASARPWILVIESTVPMSSVPSHGEWIDLVLARGYKEVFFDGLSRFFISAEHPELETAFATPVNVFDGFQISVEHYLCGQVREHFRQIEEAREQRAAAHFQLLTDQLESQAASVTELQRQVERAERAHSNALLEAAQSEARLEREQQERLEALRRETNLTLGALAEKHDAETKFRAAVAQSLHQMEQELADMRSSFWKRLSLAFRGYAPRTSYSVLDNFVMTDSRSAPISANSQEIPPMPSIAPKSLNQLLSLRDEQFVIGVYQMLLGREPDAEGAAYYLKRLRTGADPVQIVVQMRLSQEGRTYNAAIPGIKRLVRRYLLLKWPVVGWVMRLLDIRPYRSSIISNPLPSASSSVISISSIPSHVDDLLSYHDEDFVRAAYAALLGRAADADGLHHYVSKLRIGDDRREILATLYKSSEAKSFRGKIVGLEAEIRPFLGYRARLRRLLKPFSSNNEREFRAVWNQLYRLETANKAVAAELDKALAKVARKLERLPKAAQRGLSERLGRAPAKLVGSAELEMRRPRPRLVYYFVDHTIQCPVNTGMQRLVRQLGRCLVEAGENIRFVKWDAEREAFALINQAELAHLGQWSGPSLSDRDLELYPLEGAGTLQPISDDVEAWLFVPEVTHVTYQKQAPTLDAIMAARALGANIAFVYYDAIPLRLPDYAAGADAHERYMQALLLADLVIPISEYSANELRSFFVQHQCAEAVPHIEAITLPGESALSNRTEAKSNNSEKLILAVGSIEPRKNQLRLIAAFEQFSSTPEGKDWQLILAGHLRGDVASEVHAAIQRNSRIAHVPQPSDEQLDELYCKAAFTVFPSVEEGFGLPILESIWYGIPCICADFGAMAEVAQGGGCMTVDTRNVAELSAAMSRLASQPEMISSLSAAAIARPMATWGDYAQAVRSMMTSIADRTRHLHQIYFWVDDTCRNRSNSGIQRVVRQLARTLLAQGYKLIPVAWDGGTLRPASQAELAHLERWNGPRANQWEAWTDPDDNVQPRWLLIPELVHGQTSAIREYADTVALRCAAIFYDAIPYKMGDVFGPAFAANHAEYMADLATFDKIFSISRYSHESLKEFLLNTRVRTNSFDHRFEVTPGLGPMSQSPRVLTIKEDAPGAIHILAVISIEPRKNVAKLLDAFEAAVEKSEREIKLTVVGRRIPNFSALADEVETFQSRMPNFSWLQDIDDTELYDLYTDAHFTVFPSLEEGFGLPIVESLWNARPCIVHEQGAMSEVAEGGGCLAIDMTDTAALTDAMCLLANDATARRAFADAAVHRALPTWEDYAQHLVRSLATDRLQDELEFIDSAKAGNVYDELANIKKRPLLSICISTYNRGPWLQVNLRQLFSQVPIPMDEVEFLVVDNASADNTEEVVQPYLSREDFRFVRNPENVGMLGNLTITAHEARGSYIWILGDDDLVKADGIAKIIDVIKSHPGIGLIYPNYAYTRETDPRNVGDDIDAFLEACPVLMPSSADFHGTVKEVATKNENLFTAIYCLIFRRDHALRAYSQDTSGRPFSTMRTSIPTSYYVLNYMMEDTAYWVGDPVLVVNFNVSWNQYASLQILERVPEAQDLAERLGSDAGEMDRWRRNLLPGFVHYWREMFENDTIGNAEFFSPERIVMRMKHLDAFSDIVPIMVDIYEGAYAQGHKAAILPTKELFGAFL